MNILALDLGTQCGWASNVGDDFKSGTWSLATDKEITAWGKDRTRRRCDHRVSRLFNWIKDGPAMDLIVFEDVEFSSFTYQTQLWSSLRAAVWLSVANRLGPMIDCVPTSTLKKFATGHGGATKEMMCNAVRHRWPNQWKPDLDDNACDAICIWNWAVVNLGRIKI